MINLAPVIPAKPSRRKRDGREPGSAAVCAGEIPDSLGQGLGFRDDGWNYRASAYV